MKEKIFEEIKELEKRGNIKVIFLIESGSRAWGWESKDSDYDVRGVFLQDYNKFEEEKQQISFIKGNLDIVLWDLKKFMKLFVNSNPSVWEWLSSDIIYLKNKDFEGLKKIYEESFNRHKLKQHYLSMARQNFEKYINNTSTANLKKYVYVLRSIACINFIEKENLPPPKNYKEIIDCLPENIKSFFQKLIKDKVKSEETIGERSKKIDEYICKFWSKKFRKDKDRFDVSQLEKIFKKITGNNKI